MRNFSLNYFISFLLLLTIEIIIAVFHFNPIIRGFLGDVLVILLLYSFFKIFIKNNTIKISFAILTFAFFIEFLQLLKITDKLNIHSKIFLIVLGSVFDVWDLVAYLIGFSIIILIEKFLIKTAEEL